MGNILYSTPTSWADAFAAADFNALGIAGGKLSTAAAVTNGTGLYLFADLSFIMVTSTVSPTTAGAYLAFALLPLLHDGSTYPENEDTTTAANQAPAGYIVATIPARAKSASTVSGAALHIPIPPGTFKWYVFNGLGVALPSSSVNMTCQYRLYSHAVS